MIEAKVVNRGNCMLCGKELTEDEGIFFCKECGYKIQVLNKIRAKIEKHKAAIDKAVSEDESKIEGMKEAYADCLELIDECEIESEEV